MNRRLGESGHAGWAAAAGVREWWHGRKGATPRGRKERKARARKYKHGDKKEALCRHGGHERNTLPEGSHLEKVNVFSPLSVGVSVGANVVVVDVATGGYVNVGTSSARGKAGNRLRLASTPAFVRANTSSTLTGARVFTGCSSRDEGRGARGEGRE